MNPTIPPHARSWIYSGNLRVAFSAVLGVQAGLGLMQTAYSALALLSG